MHARRQRHFAYYEPDANRQGGIAGIRFRSQHDSGEAAAIVLELEIQSGFYVSKEVKDLACRAAGETETG